MIKGKKKSIFIYLSPESSSHFGPSEGVSIGTIMRKKPATFKTMGGRVRKEREMRAIELRLETGDSQRTRKIHRICSALILLQTK